MEKKKDDRQTEKTVVNDKSGNRKLKKGLQQKSVEDCSPPEKQKEKVSDGTVDQKNQGWITNKKDGEEPDKNQPNKSINNSRHLKDKQAASEHPYYIENNRFSKVSNAIGSHREQVQNLGNKSRSQIPHTVLATDNTRTHNLHPSNPNCYSIQPYKYGGYYRSSEKRENIQECNGNAQEYRGLKNMGNTCYANSALQCIYKSKYFNLKFQEEFTEIAKRSQNYKQLTRYYYAFLEELSIQKPSSPFVPIQLKNFIASKNPIFEYGQNDSIQFFSTFLMALGQELNRSPPIKNRLRIDHSLPDDQLLEKTKQRDRGILWSIVDETFTGYYKTTYICKECEQGKYGLFEKFNVHYLPVPKLSWYERKIPTLEECLDTFKKEQQMRGDHAMGCDRCDKNQTTIKKMEVYEANQIIVICFKRFQGHFKNNQEIDIPFQLLPSQLVANEKDSQYKKKTYKLYAAIIHLGYSLNGGHYYAYCRLDDDYWLKCNDSWVDKVEKRDVSLRDAYALFYSLEDTDPSKENQIFQRETNTKKYN